MMSISFDLENYRNIQNLLGWKVDAFLERSVTEVTEFMDNKAAENIQERIYQQPASASYRRTGSARDGREVVREAGVAKRFRMDSRLKGVQGKDYTKFLNRNKRIAKFNTHFWDDAVKDTKEETPKILTSVFNDILKEAKNGVI